MRLFLWFSNTVKFVKYTAFPAFVKTFSSPFFVLLLWRKPSAFNFRLGSKIKWVKEGYQPTPSLKVHLQTFACKNYREVRLLKKRMNCTFLESLILVMACPLLKKSHLSWFYVHCKLPFILSHIVFQTLNFRAQMANVDFAGKRTLERNWVDWR